MSFPETGFEARAWRAYEWGRLVRASVQSLLLVPLVAVALAGCSPTYVVISSAALLLVVVTVLRWRGEDWGRGVVPGITAGLLPLLFPVFARCGGHLCGAGACLFFPAACAAGGLAGGALLGAVAPLPRAGRTLPFVIACTVAAMTGAVGCLFYGLIGPVVMAAGLAVGAVPLMAVRKT